MKTAITTFSHAMTFSRTVSNCIGLFVFYYVLISAVRIVFFFPFRIESNRIVELDDKKIIIIHVDVKQKLLCEIYLKHTLSTRENSNKLQCSNVYTTFLILFLNF